jgi:hypothetical protein
MLWLLKMLWNVLTKIQQRRVSTYHQVVRRTVHSSDSTVTTKVNRWLSPNSMQIRSAWSQVFNVMLSTHHVIVSNLCILIHSIWLVVHIPVLFVIRIPTQILLECLCVLTAHKETLLWHLEWTSKTAVTIQSICRCIYHVVLIKFSL